MKKYLLFVIAIFIGISAIAQINIDQNDMPEIDDTIRISITNNSSSIDYTQTGANFTWDFSTLNMFNQRVDTFLSVLSTPLAYIATFNNPFDQEHLATYAGTQPNYPAMPNISITEVYNFYKNTAASYSQVGIGAKFNNVPMPVKYSNPDVLLTFPLVYGDKDSSDFEFNLNIPALGYYGEKKHRVNIVDGWGTMITPLDTFAVMLVRSEIDVHDTVFVDSLGFGFPISHTETEYKWFADNMKIPVMKIAKRNGFGGSTTVEYIDVYPIPASVSESNLFGEQLLVAPNPSTNNVLIRFYAEENTEVSLKIFDVCGKLLYQNKYNCIIGHNDQNFDVSGFENGLYIITVENSNTKSISRFMKN